jgi:hypothetical protein
MDRWTRLGIEAYRTGNREQAQRFFHYALMERPNDIRTWLWLVEVADNDIEKQRGLTRVLALDPNHVLARHALEEVDARLANKNASYVAPFEQDASPNGEGTPRNSAVEIRSTPPFIENLAQKHARARATSLPAKEAQAMASRRRTWIAIGFALVVLVIVLLMLGWSLHLFGG